MEYCKARAAQERSRKAATKTQEFVIDEERYNRRISVTKEELSNFEHVDSLRESNANRERELFESYEEEYEKSFKMSKNVREIERARKGNGEREDPGEERAKAEAIRGRRNTDRRPTKLKNIISSLIQNKKTLKDEVHDLMTGSTQPHNPDSQASLQRLSSRVSSLSSRFHLLLSRIQASNPTLRTPISSRLAAMLNTPSQTPPPTISAFKKAFSIKVPTHFTTLDKILENDYSMSMSPKKKKTTLKSLRRLSTSVEKLSVDSRISSEHRRESEQGMQSRSKSLKKERNCK